LFAKSGFDEKDANADRSGATIRTIIDGRTTGFCKLIVDRKTAEILGCHVVGESAVEIAQVAAIAMSAGIRVNDLARAPLAFPTYIGNLAYAAAFACRELNLDVEWHANNVEGVDVGAFPGAALKQ
jgi:pyruvate/2-oxoglutarate dehydrogenase complex dihydrolipoamide dehydrogenase (E3) component